MREDQQAFEASYQPIGNYGIIGNLHTVALVSLYGSIDFMCFMRFDSPTVFCKLLDADRGGSFSIKPQMPGLISKQLYLPDTNILVTRFFADDGIAEIIDYMPVSYSEFNCAIIRKITTVRGRVPFRLQCAPRFDYARVSHHISKEDNGFLLVPATGNQSAIRLISNIPMLATDKDVVAEFTLTENEQAYFLLEAEHNKENRVGSVEEYVTETYKNTLDYWQAWIEKCNYNGRWKEMVHRSALTLKLLTSHRYGSMVAAPTFSLPEAIGKSRNWDYRYTWIRDAAFTMHVFLELGLMDEAEAFLGWVKEQSTKGRLQLMLAIDGESNLKEYELQHLEGYKGSKPVRIGNAAYQQTQMDIYGELMETIYIYVMHGGDITYEFWKTLQVNVEYVINNWQKPDHSIWEIRGTKREFLFSRIMCWVTVDRAIKIAAHFSFPFDLLKWHGVRNEIYLDINENFWNEEVGAFVQFKGASSLDASALLMPILHVISPNSDRWKRTMQAIEKELRFDVLLYRYKEKGGDIDGISDGEGTFTMCSFWYVECLSMAGQKEKAREYFEKMEGYANHLGLYAEQLGKKGEHLGNFPQAFTHIGLISAAIEMTRGTSSGITDIPSCKSKMK